MSDFSKHIKALANRFPNAVGRAINAIAVIVQEEAKNSNLYKGNILRNSIKIVNSGTFARTVLADQDYAYWVEEGNNQKGAYIYPTHAKALRFLLNGTIVYRKFVKAHGPLPFMANAGKIAEKKAITIIEKELTNWLK